MISTYKQLPGKVTDEYSDIMKKVLQILKSGTEYK